MVDERWVDIRPAGISEQHTNPIPDRKKYRFFKVSGLARTWKAGVIRLKLHALIYTLIYELYTFDMNPRSISPSWGLIEPPI
jgi:hypothetical protein